MMMSLFVGVCLLTLVNIELILRNIVRFFGGGDKLPLIPEHAAAGAE